ISDGENHRDDALSAAKKASEKGVVVHTIGMGTKKGAPIPIYKNGRQVGYKKDDKGNTVVSKLNQTMLERIADRGNGVFVRATNTKVGLNHMFEQVKKMEKTEFKTNIYVDHEDRFQIFLLLALICLFIEPAIAERSSGYLERLRLGNDE
ncbi:MAG: BatB protein, partial [Flavobacteriales bacterium]